MGVKPLKLVLRWLGLAFTVGLLLSACGADSPEKSRAKANAALGKNEFGSAEIHLKNLLQADPSDGQARVMLASVYAHKFDWISAEKELRSALAIGVDRNQVVPALMAAMARTSPADRLLAVADSANVDQTGAKAEVAYWRGVAFQQSGDSALAKAQFESALKLDPAYTPAKVGLVRVSNARTEPVSALRDAQALVAAAPTSTEALLLKADLSALVGDVAESKDALSKILAVSPFDFFIRNRLARVEIGLGNLDEAARMLADVLTKVPNFYPAWTQKAELELRRNQPDAARDAILQSLKIAPDDLETIATAANVFLRVGQLEQAEMYSRRMIERAPGSPVGQQLLANTLLRRGMAKESLAILKSLIDNGANDLAVFNLAGAAALRLGAYRDAKSYFDVGLKIGDGNIAGKTGVGLAMLGAGDKAHGVEALEAISTQSPKVIPADYELVSALLRDKKIDVALTVIDRIERKDSKLAVVPFLRGQVLDSSGDSGKAREQFEKALSLDPQLVQALASLATLDVKDGKLKEASARVEKFVAANPRSTEALLMQADLAARAKAPREEVIAIIRRAEAVDKSDLRAILAMSRVHRAAKHALDAVPILQQALQLNPNRIDLLVELVNASVETGEVEQAKYTLDKLSQVTKDSADAQLKIGRLRESIGDSAGALAAIKRAQVLAPNAVQPKIALAASLLRAGRSGEAREIARSLQKEQPDSPVGLLLEADTLGAMGQWAEAATRFGQVLKRTPDNPQLAIRAHSAMFHAGQGNDATVVLEQALRASPRDLNLLLYAGEKALAQKHWTEAVTLYGRALEVRPAHPVALNNLAWSLLRSNDPKALNVAEQAHKAAVDSPAIIDTLALALMASKNTANVAQALDLHRRAIALAPREPELRLSYLKSLLQGGDSAGARRELEILVREFPTTNAAKIAIEQVKPKL